MSNALGMTLIWLTVYVVLSVARRVIYNGPKSMMGAAAGSIFLRHKPPQVIDLPEVVTQMRL